MSTKPKAARYFLRRVERPQEHRSDEMDAVAADMAFSPEDSGFRDVDFRPPLSDQEKAAAKSQPVDGAALAAVAAEGLTGRQLRRARLLAQKHGFDVGSDLHAVVILRQNGIDPLLPDGGEALPGETGKVAHLVTPSDPGPQAATEANRALTRVPGERAKVPAKSRQIGLPSTETRADQSQLAEIERIQREIAQRRRRQVALLFARLFVFVFLPTVMAGFYFYKIATPVYATHSEFVIQSADGAQQGGGLGGLLSGTGLASAQDANALQGFLQSPEAMERLETDVGFRAHFQNPEIDALQRLEPDATLADTYDVYQRFVKVSHDPTEGIIRLEVMAMDPETAATWAKQLIKYAEEQVDQLTKRMRDDQMADAKASYEDALSKLSEARRALVQLQEKFKVLNTTAEVTLYTEQIGALEGQLLQERLSLAQMEANANPNEARMDPVKQRIATLEEQIATLRDQMTEGDGAGDTSLAEVQGQLLIAQADVETRQLILAQALQSMETSRIEAGRQVRYLSVSVSPTLPDEPSYPRAFENTLVTLLILFGIYLMVSMTAAILREQVSA